MQQCNNVKLRGNHVALRNKTMQRGIALYLALIVMFILLGIGLGISTILIGQIKIIRGVGNSVVAFYAADTGVERVLYAIRKEGYCSPPPLLPVQPFIDVALGNGATYTVTITACNGATTIDSKGTYQETRRAIEITY